MPNISLLALAATKGLVGTSTILFPNPVARLFFLPESLTWVQLFGSRDAMAAGLLLTADTHDAKRRALWASILCDAVDTLTCGVAYLQGSLAWQPALLAGGGAFALALVGLGGLRTLENAVARAKSPVASSSSEPLL